MTDMKAAVLHQPGDVRLEERPVPSPGPGEVLIRIRAVGVCGSDVHYYQEGRIGVHVVEKPLILGHESAGEVVALGAGVRGLAVGARVATEPGVPCRRCRQCLRGRYNLCPRVSFMATPPVDGAFVEYITWPAEFVYPLPASLSYAEGSLMEPLAVGLHAVRRARLTVGATVLVLGAGPIGQLALVAAHAAGAGQAIVADLEDSRLAVARRVDPRALAVNPARQSLMEAVMSATDGEGADVVIEAAGSVRTVGQSIELVRPGGVVVLVGLPAVDPSPISVLEAIRKEVDILGVFRYANVYRDALRLAASGRVDLSPLITHRFPLTEVRRALDTVAEAKGSALKVVVDV